MPEGTFQRNRHHVVRTPLEENNSENICDDPNQPELSLSTSERQSSQVKVYQTRSKSGRTPKPPERFDNMGQPWRKRDVVLGYLCIVCAYYNSILIVHSRLCMVM